MHTKKTEKKNGPSSQQEHAPEKTKKKIGPLPTRIMHPKKLEIKKIGTLKINTRDSKKNIKKNKFILILPIEKLLEFTVFHF